MSPNSWRIVFALADGAQEGRKVIDKKEFLWDLGQEYWNSGNVLYSF